MPVIWIQLDKENQMYSINKKCKHFSFYLLLFGLFSGPNIFAEETTSISPVSTGDIIYDIPEVDIFSLTNNTEDLRKLYREQQNRLTQQVVDKEMNVGDVLISIILPGGLIYAGYKKQKLQQAKDHLLSITTEINDLSDDLIAIHTQSVNHSLILAQ